MTRPFEALEPIEDITVKLNIGGSYPERGVPAKRGMGKMRARALKLGRPLETRGQDEWLVMRLPRLEIFETIVLG